MPRSKTPTVSLEEAKIRFEEWRQNRKGKAAIPDELWSAAAEVARKEGVSRTSTELRVEWNELKRRMTAAAGVSRRTAPPAFVELVAPEAAIASGMHHRTGRPPRQAANPVKGRFGFLSGDAEP